jgi:uncharacterized lipoprotein YajG
MRTLSICIALLALHGLLAGCQKREPTRPAQPTVAAARTAPASTEPSRCSAAMAAIAQSVRRRHLYLP